MCALSCHYSLLSLFQFAENIRTSRRHLSVQQPSWSPYVGPYVVALIYRQLAEVRKANQDKSGGARVVEAEKKLIICAVKKPLKLNESQDGQSRVSTAAGTVENVCTHSSASRKQHVEHCCTRTARTVSRVVAETQKGWLARGLTPAVPGFVAILLCERNLCCFLRRRANWGSYFDLRVLQPLFYCKGGVLSDFLCSLRLLPLKRWRCQIVIAVPPFPAMRCLVLVLVSHTQTYERSMGGFKSAIDSLMGSNR